MCRTVLVVILIISICCGISAVVNADEVWMKNGDHLTGHVVQLKDGTLTLETAYAGTISIQWAEVKTFRTETAVRLRLADETEATARVKSGDGGKVKLTIVDLGQTIDVGLAQVSLINPDPPPPAVTLSGRVNAGVNISDGNTQNKAYSTDGEFISRGIRNRFTLGWLYLQEKSEGKRSADNATGYLKYDHFLNEKWYLQANTTGTTDDFKDLNLRTDTGLGVGYQVWESKKRNLALEMGVSYVNEDYDVAPDEDYAAGRWGVNFDHLLTRAGLQFFHKHNGLFGFEDADDLIIRSLTGFRIPLYKNLNATTQVQWDWDNQPAEGTENSDLNYLFTLGYSF